MDRKPLRIGEKVAQVPIIQGGMGIGISLGGLSGAVAKEGGIGDYLCRPNWFPGAGL